MHFQNRFSSYLPAFVFTLLFLPSASSNLHKEEFLRGFEEDSCSDDGSDYSMDQISLHEKSLSARSSSNYLPSLEEVS